ncbi:hypothetical protein B0G81_0408 [Paraburkholderia sp. BL6665CI2N2]|nr:hypothetical protein B0G81_0408 [Paraburkholderia sp. BL6665CI2N2]
MQRDAVRAAAPISGVVTALCGCAPDAARKSFDALSGRRQKYPAHGGANLQRRHQRASAASRASKHSADRMVNY